MEFCRLCALEGASVSELCLRFGISRRTGYVWLKRVRSGEAAQERSRRPPSNKSKGAFDRWRDLYNHYRPYQGIAMAVPASRYRPSSRSFPAPAPEPVYDPGKIVRRVSSTRAYVAFKGQA
ncbi:helix-turn-helix domain-containing protein [Martelella mediterranea]|uniref:helix-turn-helix domain-containing protein n=1 Tax=Martelella mediterranea TaxID=293089 RepID=UPI0022A97B0D|nr:helix-turn-helix domain-containing protein [Martelella mediterranea]